MSPVFDTSERPCSVDECREPAVVVHQNTIGTGKIVHVGYCSTHWQALVRRSNQRWSER